MCSPKSKDIQKGVNDALVYVGIPVVLAASMAAIITPAAIILSPVGL